MNKIEADMWAVIRSNQTATQELRAMATANPVAGEIQAQLDKTEATMQEVGISTDALKPSPSIHWLSLLLGACIGAGMVALAINLSGGFV